MVEDRHSAEAVAAALRWLDFGCGGASRLIPLSGGYRSGTFRVELSDGPAVLRILEESTAHNGLAFGAQAELEASRLAASCGVAPAIRHYAADVPALVIDFLQVPTMTSDTLALPATLKAVAETCRRLHRCGLSLERVWDPFARIDLLLEGRSDLPSLPTNGFDDAVRLVRGLRARLARSRGPLVPCHNDLHPGQILASPGRAVFVDWELGAMGDPACELATLAAYSNLDSGATDLLCEMYFDAAVGSQRERVETFLPVMLLLSILWWSTEIALFPHAARRDGHDQIVAEHWRALQEWLTHHQPLL